jgi:predicted nucleic acid-binding Zn ribbon protein
MHKSTTKKLCPICGNAITGDPRNNTCSIRCGRLNKSNLRQPVYQTDTDTYLVILTKGYNATVDACDIDITVRFNWSALVTRQSVYAARRLSEGGKQTTIMLHREVLERKIGRQLVDGEFCDHINGDGLDNRRDNLRVASAADNVRNRRMHVKPKSGIKGVYQSGVSSWSAAIRVNKKPIYIGTYPTPEQAQAAYIAAAEKHFGQFANDGINSTKSDALKEGA